MQILKHVLACKRYNHQSINFFQSREGVHEPTCLVIRLGGSKRMVFKYDINYCVNSVYGLAVGGLAGFVHDYAKGAFQI